MKLVLTFALFVITSTCFSQKEKIDFNKQIRPLLESQNSEKAVPLLHSYYNQNLLTGEIWRPKVILLEANTMYYTEKILGDSYFSKAENTGKQLDRRSYKLWKNEFNRSR